MIGQHKWEATLTMPMHPHSARMLVEALTHKPVPPPEGEIVVLTAYLQEQGVERVGQLIRLGHDIPGHDVAGLWAIKSIKPEDETHTRLKIEFVSR